jgi:hypothetical protein
LVITAFGGQEYISQTIRMEPFVMSLQLHAGQPTSVAVRGAEPFQPAGSITFAPVPLPIPEYNPYQLENYFLESSP